MTKVAYPDRAQADERLLTYTSAPLREDLEATGHPVVTLHVTSTATDGRSTSTSRTWTSTAGSCT